MLQVSEELIAETIADLKRCLPQEGVGLWSGREREVLRWRSLQNVAADLQTGYLVQPQEWLEALAEVRQAGLAPLALVHSHPTAAAVPSARDRREWMYPELWCVIVSFQDRSPVWQAYQIKRTAP
ncbi:proteasome lid subunit RPN8/RPN11 [Tumebacillus sp. BK434]|uniref:Mov34/MPN/PAD-1 family protein n=1 Tax=Tumebacillus sp. BK434 TaxID=2512169 RepID=UPI00104F2499|nr:M67 family metallopeptidase [Tumebacillus sp. BK434]TCP59659.1 proteasome lid subunit RPN8/RPN11 [Tumebacillus sp. BK434]